MAGIPKLERLKKAKQSMAAEERPKPASSVSEKLSRRKEADEATGNRYGAMSEVVRITNVPICMPYMSKEDIDRVTREYALASAVRSGFKFFGVQARAIETFRRYGSMYVPVPVGGGKTLISLACADIAYKSGKRKILLSVPPEVLQQLVDEDIRFARRSIPFSVPVHVLGGKPQEKRKELYDSGQKGLYIVSDSLFSVKDTDEMLAAIDPDLFIVDELHRVAKRKSAKGRRISLFMEERNMDAVFLSGTVTSKSILDYFTFSRYSLKDRNFLPNSLSMAKKWDLVIGAEQIAWGDDSYEEEEDREEGETDSTPVEPLVDWVNHNFPGADLNLSRSDIRKALAIRMATTPGVVVSNDDEIDSKLVMYNLPVEGYKSSPRWEELNNLMKQVDEAWITPDGDEIDHAIHKWKWLYEMSSAGFYNRQVWPDADTLARRAKIDEAEAEEILERAMEFHEADQEFRRELRYFLQHHAKSGLDTPLLVENSMRHHGGKRVTEDLHKVWAYKESLDFDDRPERDKMAVRVCPFKIDHWVEWAKNTKEGAILWVWNKGVGEWLSERLLEEGVDSLYAGAGENAMIKDRANKDKKIVASIRSHGTGKNLQFFRTQAVVQWPRSAVTAQQMLGRLHRSGQTANQVSTFRADTLEFDQMVFASCLMDSLYIDLTTWGRMKMIHCDYKPLPKVFPEEVLAERGFQGVRILDTDQKKRLSHLSAA